MNLNRIPFKNIRHRLEYILLTGFSDFSCLLSQGSAYRIARWLSRLARLLLKVRVNVAERNLAMAFPEMTAEKRQEIVRKTFEHFCYTFVELMRLPKMKPEEILKSVNITDMAKVHRFCSVWRYVITPVKYV